MEKQEKEVNGQCDADDFNWASGTQESKIHAYVRPAALPAKAKPKAQEFVKGDADGLVEIAPVKRLGVVEVRRPKRQEWFRAHPQMLSEVSVIQQDDSFYLVHPDFAAELGDEAREAYLAAAINSDGALFLWPIVKPKADGNGSQLFDQALEDLALSRSAWVRRRWDRGAKTYRIAQTDKEPEWPENTNIVDWIEKAFKGAFIDEIEHPVVRKLRGEFV